MGPAPVSWQSCWRGSVRECGPDSLSVAVVERVDSCASMYSRSIQGHHVCLLVKKGESSVSVDGKSNDATLLSSLLEEMKATLAQC